MSFLINSMTAGKPESSKRLIADGCKAAGIDEKEYRERCLNVWGAVPYDVEWMIQQPIYKNVKP